MHVAFSEIRLTRVQARTRLAHLAGDQKERVNALRAVDAVVVMIEAEFHIRLHVAFLRVQMSEMFDVVSAHAGHFRGMFQSPRRDGFSDHLHLRFHGMPGNLGNVAHSRLLGFAVSNGLAGFFVPHNARIDLLFLALRVGGRSRFYPQIAHAQEHAVFFDEERRFGMISQEVRRFPALFENLAHDSQSKRAVGRRMNGNEPVGFRSHGAVGDVDDYELGAGIAGLEIKMRALLVRHRSVTTPDHMMVSVGNVRSTVSGRAGAEHVGPRHGRGDYPGRTQWTWDQTRQCTASTYR